MKRTVNINLAGRPFTIDEDAYDVMENYLAQLSRHFFQTEGSDEIMDDIEARLAELIEEQKKLQAIVTVEHVRAAMAILGRPQDFGAQEYSSSQQEGPTYKVGKKLFKDPDHKVIAGVCSGLSAYFGIPDPIWVRLAFVVGVPLTAGTMFMIYLVMWVLVPKAKTSSDFLAMRGEPININSIAREVEEKFQDISEQIQDFGKEFRNSRKKK